MKGNRGIRACLLLAVAGCCVIGAALPAEAEVTTTWGSWAQLVGEGNLGFADECLADVGLWLEGQMRWNEDWQHQRDRQ